MSPARPTVTFTAIGSVPACWFSSAVTSICWAVSSSDTEAVSRERDTEVDAVSSSFRVSVASSTERPLAVPCTVISSAPSASSSSTGVRVNVAVPSVCPAGIVTVTAVGAVKSALRLAPSPDAPTVTETMVVPGRVAAFSAAVTSTETEPASSIIESGSSDRDTEVEAASSSRIVRMALP